MQLPILRYDGPLHVCITDADLVAAANAIQHERVIGFDTEARPTFRKGPAHLPCLVQVATSKAVFLFQLNRLDCAAVLTAIFENARILKTGIAVGRDLSELQKLFQFQPASILDLGDVAKKNGLEQTGIRNLAGLFLRSRITKGAQTSNWAAPELSAKQLTYAATDAWICRELYLKFESLGWFAKKTGEIIMPSFLHTRIRVSNLDQSVAWYEQLGFRCIRRTAKSPAGNQLAYLEIAGSQHFLELCHSPEYRLKVPEDLMHTAVGYPDLIAKCDELEKKGVAIWPDGWREKFKTGGKMAFITDPDGYEVELLET